jgi:hypothetical protein
MLQTLTMGARFSMAVTSQTMVILKPVQTLAENLHWCKNKIFAMRQYEKGRPSGRTFILRTHGL